MIVGNTRIVHRICRAIVPPRGTPRQDRPPRSPAPPLTLRRERPTIIRTEPSDLFEAALPGAELASPEERHKRLPRCSKVSYGPHLQAPIFIGRGVGDRQDGLVRKRGPGPRSRTRGALQSG